MINGAPINAVMALIGNTPSLPGVCAIISQISKMQMPNKTDAGKIIA